MIFKSTWEAILDGRKTQTRRLVKPGDLCPLTINDCCMGIMRNDRLIWQVGHSYAIQPGRGKKAVGRFLLLAIRREYLQDITGKDAIAEGFQPIQHTAPGVVLIPDLKIADAIAIEMFAEYWDSLHRPQNRWHKNPEVWCLSLELVGQYNDVA